MMKTRTALTVMAVALIVMAGRPAFATAMDDLKAAGYSCGRGGVDSIVCTKKDAPTKYCDNSGACTRMTGGAKNPTSIGQIGGVKASETRKGTSKGAAGGGNILGVMALTAQECERLEQIL